MGGRGGSSGRQKAPAPAAPKDPWEDILGPKSDDPRILEDAIIVTNPSYRKGKEWRINCQRCVWAYEAQRRGYDVEALPNREESGDLLPYTMRNGWPGVIKDGISKLVSMPSRNTIKAMNNQMKQWGDGARAIVRVQWKGRNSGHVFIAEQRNGQTIYCDPQSGKLIDVKTYMDLAVKKDTMLLRTDNAEFTDLIQKAVKRRGT